MRKFFLRRPLHRKVIVINVRNLSAMPMEEYAEALAELARRRVVLVLG